MRHLSELRTWTPLLAAALMLAACTGPPGDAGLDGAAGADGADGLDGVGGEDGRDGSDGSDGVDLRTPGRAGAATCAVCHEDEHQAWLRSGHAWAMSAVDGAPDQEPWDELGDFGHFPTSPPDGVLWDDVSFVIGGWGWKQAYLDESGWLVTGEEAVFRLADDGWSELMSSAEPGSVAADCVACHSSGFRSNDEHQDGLAGIPGQWSAVGVDCEECHGHGALHAADPWSAPMTIDRAAESCGRCHSRGDDLQTIPASDGLVEHGAQWNEMASSKHRALDCADCHNPHRSALHEDDQHNPDRGIVASCEGCHFHEAASANSEIMGGFSCEVCHMPPLVRSAVGAADAFAGDMASHQFAINRDPAAEQFRPDGSANPWITLDYACRWCHLPDGGPMGSPKTDEELAESALGYHAP